MQTQTGMEATELDQIENYLSSGEKYRHEWRSLLASVDPNLDQLRQLAYNGDLKVSKFRSICWSILLRVLSSNSSDWPGQREQQRQRYQKLKEEFAKNPHNINSTNDNPLSQSKQSLWNQYFGDQELFSVIKQDVIRTFPGVDFFRKPFVQEAMTNILFYYAREHPYMSYRQGMHEILAPILFVMFYDHQSLLHFKELSENIDPLLASVLNPNYLEEDSYSIFSRLMSSIESYYRIANMMPTSEAYFPTAKYSSNEELQQTEVEVIGQLNLIRDKILAREDQHLHNHLQKLEIPLHIFGIRWLRLLFGREFPLLDLLMLWDAIFAESDNFQLPNYILVAMLIRIRDKLLLNDYTSCLTYLMKYPTNVDIGLILRHALHMHSPNRFERPHNAFIYVTVEHENTKIGGKPHFYRQLKINTLPKKHQKPLRSASKEDDIKFDSEISQRNRSSSLTLKRNNDMKSNANGLENLTEQKQNIQSTIKELQYANVVNLAKIEQLSRAYQSADENVILDGYSEQSPDYLRLQLQNAHTVITVSRIKLGKYLETLQKYSNNCPDDLCQVIDGIGELCAFLEINFAVDKVSNIPLPVDAAFEANENQLKMDKISLGNTMINTNIQRPPKLTSPFVYVDVNNSNKDKTLNTTNLASQSKPNLIVSDAISKAEFVKILESNKKHPYEIQVGEDGNAIDFKSPPKIKNNDSSENLAAPYPVLKNNTRYEIPDTGFMQNSHRILGARKDVELTLFKEKKGSKEGLPNIDPLNLNLEENEQEN